MKQQKIWALVILALVAFSALIVRGKPIRVGHTTVLGSHPTKYGLDIKGGVRAIFQVRTDLAPGVPYDEATIQRIIENRIANGGVSEAVVQPRPQEKQFIVELPDVKNKNAIMEQLGTTAKMIFYYWPDVASDKYRDRPIQMSIAHDPKTGHEVYSFFDQRTQQRFRDGAQIRADFSDLMSQGMSARPCATAYAIPAPLSNVEHLPETLFFTTQQQQKADDLNREYTAWKALTPDEPNPNIILTGADLEPKSSAELAGTGSTPAVSQVFNDDGRDKFAKFTTEHTGEINGIVLDDAVISAPYIETPILDGQAQISGGFATLNEAQSLANLLNAGSLPIPLEQVQTQNVEASLGVGAVTKSLTAGLVGLALVLVFMLVYYRLPGLVADVALCIYALFTLAIFKGALSWLFPGLVVTLTLPGIAGFILSIGMAVDANILIFERLKEELRSGKALRPAIDAAFKRAFSAIRDSNICTSITCIVLLSLGTASVRGFALTLLIGVLVSLFSAITVTRTLLYLLVDAGIGNNVALFGLNMRSLRGGDTASAPTPNIIGRRKFFYGLSLAIIVPGLIFYALGGLKKSIEFKGGTQIQVHYAQPVTQGQVQKALASGDFKDSTVQMADAGTTAIVSVPQSSTEANPVKNPVRQGLLTALDPLAPHDTDPTKFVQQFGIVRGIISRELTTNAIEAVIMASALIVLYLALVFGIGGFVAGLRLGTSAIVALLHDVLVLIGAFSIFGYFLGWEIDSLFVTALLTVIGFSVHDTVVIFDRVRENLRHKARGESFESLVNRSIGQTLARSINTSLTVVMTLLALVILGGTTTRLLNVALLIGIVSGTYSSIFNAASILVDWENWLAKRRAHAPMLATADAGTGGTASGGAAIYPSNGGSQRPQAPLPSSLPRAAAPGEVQISAIKAKKKRPAKRF